MDNNDIQSTDDNDIQVGNAVFTRTHTHREGEKDSHTSARTHAHINTHKHIHTRTCTQTHQFPYLVFREAFLQHISNIC